MLPRSFQFRALHSVRTSRKVGGSILRPVQKIGTLSCRCASLRSSKGKCKRCRQEDTASHNCNRHWIVGRHSKHKASHGPDPRQGLVAAQERGKPLKVVWLPAARPSHSERRVEQGHILKAIQQTMLAYGPSPRKISNPFSGRVGRSF